MPVVTIIDENAMQTELSKAAGKLVVIDFTATWCGPCKQIGPFFEELSDQYPSTLFLKCDVDDNSEIAMEYQVSAMPTFIFLKKLKEIDRVLGADYKILEHKVHTLSASTSSFQHQILDTPPALPSRNINQQQQQQQQPPPPRKGSNQLNNIGSKNYESSTASTTTTTTNNFTRGKSDREREIVANQNRYGMSNGGPVSFLNSDQQKISNNAGSRLLPPGYPVYFPPQFQSSGHQTPNPMTMTMTMIGGSGNNRFSDDNRILQQKPDRNELIHSTEVSNGQTGHIQMVDNVETKSETVSATTTTKESSSISSRGRKRSSHRTKSTSRRDSTPLNNSSKMNKENETMAQKALKVKKKLPTSVIQIRLVDGSIMTATFNTTHTVSKIREFINNARPLYATKSFRLMTFPSREITNEDISLQDANLINAVVVQKLT